MHVDTKKVIEAASTKWNFAKYYPVNMGLYSCRSLLYYISTKFKYNYPELGLQEKQMNRMADYCVFLKKY